MKESSDQRLCLFLWPAMEFAGLCRAGELGDCAPRGIEGHDLLDRLLPMLERDHVLLAVFCTPSNMGAVVDVDVFRKDLRDELSRIE